MIEPLQRLFNQQYLVIWNGEEILQKQSIAESGIRDNDKILLIGVPSAAIDEGSRIKMYKRFRDFKQADYWYVGRDRWDAIMFIPTKRIKVVGLLLFEVHPNGGPFTMGFKYCIQDENGNEVY